MLAGKPLVFNDKRMSVMFAESSHNPSHKLLYLRSALRSTLHTTLHVLQVEALHGKETLPIMPGFFPELTSQQKGRSGLCLIDEGALVTLRVSTELRSNKIVVSSFC